MRLLKHAARNPVAARQSFLVSWENYCEAALKVLFWIIGIIFLIGLLVVSGVLKLIF